VATRWWWCVTRRFARTAAAFTDRRTSVAIPAIACVRSGRKNPARNAVCYASNLKRRIKRRRDLVRGISETRKAAASSALAEQHLGEWQGLDRAAFFASRPIEVGSYWFAPIDDPAPGGESFMDLYNRVRGAIERSTPSTRQGRDRRCAWRNDQGGDWPCARHQAGAAASLYHRQLFVTRLDHLASAGHSGWRDADGQPAAVDAPTHRTKPCISRGTGNRDRQQLA